MKNNITNKTNSVIITDNFLLGNLIKETINVPMIVFQNISNSYIILREIEKTNIQNILFVFRLPQINENLDYIINRIFRDLIPLGYNLDIKYINDYKDFFTSFDICFKITSSSSISHFPVIIYGYILLYGSKLTKLSSVSVI